MAHVEKVQDSYYYKHSHSIHSSMGIIIFIGAEALPCEL